MSDSEEELLALVDGNQEEGEDDLGPINATSAAQAVVTSSDWTTETILSQLRRKNIDLNPRFQRRDAWSPERKSRFIESLILGLPVPQLVLAEAKGQRGTYIVIDGKQRLLALVQFATKDQDGSDFKTLKLGHLKNREDLNGQTLWDLENNPAFASDLTAFENQTIRTVVVKNWPNENFLYTVFLRLNTGSLPLSPQELRRALHPGKFVDFVDDFSYESARLRKALGLKKPDFRMRDVELCVRYYAFRHFMAEYKGNLKKFLDDTCMKLNEAWANQEDQIREEAQKLEKSLVLAAKVFGAKNAFRRYTGSKYEGRFNRAVFDVMVYYFSSKSVAEKVLANKELVKRAFEDLCSGNEEFARSIETTTKSISATHTRISLWCEELKRVTKAKLRVPRLIDNRIVP
jgi:hypothetical protein